MEETSAEAALMPAVLVTGATGGIGQSICRVLSQAGYSIVAHYHQDERGARVLREAISAEGGRCQTVQADLRTPNGPYQLAETTLALTDADSGTFLYGVVNNAAVLTGPPFEETSVDAFDEIFSVNVRAALLLIKELVSSMPYGGSIVNVSSASAHISSPGNPLYAMSKAALESMTRNLAERTAPLGVRINAVVPGFTDNGHPAFNDPVALAYMSSFASLGGVAQPDVVALAVRFLLSPESGRTTGSLLDVSGGTTLAPRGGRASSIRDVVSTTPAD